ncbi:hypothetical protein GOODEAATRI_030877, partial [Goodea atripinnis]
MRRNVFSERPRETLRRSVTLAPPPIGMQPSYVLGESIRPPHVDAAQQLAAHVQLDTPLEPTDDAGHTREDPHTSCVCGEPLWGCEAGIRVVPSHKPPPE